MKKWRENMGQVALISSFWAVVWLVAAMEFGAAGSWAMWFVVGIVLTWGSVFAYASWEWKEEGRRQERKSTRVAKRIIEQTEKEFYLRNAAA